VFRKGRTKWKKQSLAEKCWPPLPALHSAVDRAVKEFGHIDIAVANAARCRRGASHEVVASWVRPSRNPRGQKRGGWEVFEAQVCAIYCGERTEYVPSATGTFPLLRCFGRAGRALLVTQLGNGVGKLRV